MTYIFNESLRNGIVHGKLKIVVVYPIWKKESRMKIGNYNLISILPIISKIYEELTYKTFELFW